MLRRSDRTVFTTEDRPVNAEEGVSIVGKKYPTSTHGSLIARYPCGVFMIILLPVVFTLIAISNIDSHMDYSLKPFHIAASHPSQVAREAVESVMTEGIARASGVDALEEKLDVGNPRSRVRDRLVLISRINEARLMKYLNATSTESTVDQLGNFLSEENTMSLREIESTITAISEYRSISFVNSLEEGGSTLVRVNEAPVSSILQYFYPEFQHTTSTFRLTGRGTIFQQNALGRIRRNPSYGWFIDREFSPTNGVAKSVRSQFSLASADEVVSRSGAITSYTALRDSFYAKVLDFIDGYSHPYIDVVVGDESVETQRVRRSVSSEMYKFALVIVIALVCCVVHTRSLAVGFYAALQLVLSYMGAWGLYYVIYRSIPLFTVPGILMILSFCVHGTLTVFDVFVSSGIMATTGRRNTLNVAQRISYTLKSASYGCCLSNVVAIVTLSINTTSVFPAVRHASIVLMFALLFNMLCVLTLTPACVALHHYHLSTHRRNLQKQGDIINRHIKGLKRSHMQVELLDAVDSNLMSHEVPYATRKTRKQVSVFGSRTVKKKPLTLIKEALLEGLGMMDAAAFDTRMSLRNMNQLRKAKLAQLEGHGEDGVSPAHHTVPEFQLDDFVEVGQANPFGPREVEEMGAKTKRPPYSNPLLVGEEEIMHVPKELTQRTTQCWAVLDDALCTAKQVERRAEATPAPPIVKPIGSSAQSEASTKPLLSYWSQVAQLLFPALRAAASERNDDAKGMKDRYALLARQLAKSHDPQWLVDGRNVPASTSHPPRADSEGRHGLGEHQESPPNHSLMEGFDEWRRRFQNRTGDGRRRYCCGLLGPLINETQAQRDMRRMRREVHRDTYTISERLLGDAAPYLYRTRWGLLALLVVLAVVAAVLGSRIVAGPPMFSLLLEDEKPRQFSRLESFFDQSGYCELCGGYYRPSTEYRVPSPSDLSICYAAGLPLQMNVFVDNCGVCDGRDTCLDCARVANGDHVVSSCGACVGPSDADVCSCSASHDCPWCEWNQISQGGAGPGCARFCDNMTCGDGGKCNPYTGRCDCLPNFVGESCDACAPGYLPITENPTCTLECSAAVDDPTLCGCDVDKGECTLCTSKAFRGVHCDVPTLQCVHGTFNFDSEAPKCVCESEYMDNLLCENSRNCSFRGPWLSVAESPFGEAGCGCRGHWRGETCQLCDCLNGGTCAPDGSCDCPGAFTGDRCQFCAATCMSNGFCPEPPPTTQWNVRSCIQEVCNSDGGRSEEVCDACKDNIGWSDGFCSEITDRETCVSSDCWWSASLGKCGAVEQASTTLKDDTQCICLSSMWEGSQCEQCKGPPGSTCAVDGTIVGCDGKKYQIPSQAPSIDACGVCGGNDFCLGCDGIIGSGKKLDSCGVCGGDGICEDLVSRVTVRVMVDATAAENSGSIENLVQAMASICESFRYFSYTSEDFAPCLMDEYRKYNMNHTYTPNELLKYALSVGRSSELVFNITADGYAVQLRYYIFTIPATITTSDSPEAIFDLYNTVLRRVAYQTNSYRYRKLVISASSHDWMDAIATVLSRQSLWFAVGFGTAAAFTLVLLVFSSASSAVGTALAVVVVVFGTLLVCWLMGWKLDAGLQVCVSPAVGVAVEYTVSTVWGYHDYLDLASSHLFAMDLTRLTAFRGSFIRSMPSIITSLIIAIASSAMFSTSSIRPFQRGGQTSIAIHLLVLIATVLLGGLMSAIGPLRLYRNIVLSGILLLFVLCIACCVVVLLFFFGRVVDPWGNSLL